MRNYLTNLITEKGVDMDTDIGIDGHIGLTYEMLVDFICQSVMSSHHATIRKTQVLIDFKNGDVFHYLRHLATGMVAACGY